MILLLLLLLLAPAAASAAGPLIVGNNASAGGGPIQTFDFSTGALVNPFVPDDANPSGNGRGLAVVGNEVFYTELNGGIGGQTDSIHVAPFNGGAGGSDIRTIPNPAPSVGVQDLDYANGALYVLSGYSNGPLQAWKLNPTSGAVLAGPIAINSDGSADGFVVLPNGNFLINASDESCTYTEYNSTTGSSTGTVITVPQAGTCTGAATDGTSLYFETDFSGFTKTDLSGNLIAHISVASNQIEDISLVSAPSPSYVAMGDSYSAGEGADFAQSAGCSFPLYQDPSGTPINTDNLASASCLGAAPPVPDDTCHRAITAYPHLVADALQLTLNFVACSGGVVHDAYANNHSNPVEPPQLSALGPKVKLVTFSFGGNDVKFKDVVTTCVNPFSKVTDCIGLDDSELGELGYNTKVGDKNDGRLVSTLHSGAQDAQQQRSLLLQFGKASGTGPSPSLLGQAGSFSNQLKVHDRLVFLLRVIRELAPGARILVLGYPRWFDPGGNSPDGVEHFKPLEERWLNDRIDLVDAVIRDAAQKSGVAQYVDVSGAFAGHEESGTTPIWPVDASGNATCHGPGSYINGIDLVAGKLGGSPELIHPNPCGHQALARAVERTYEATRSRRRHSAPVLPPGADIRVTSHHSHFLECKETFQAHIDKAGLRRVASFSWYNDGGDLVTDISGPKHDTMTMSAHSAFHFLLVENGTSKSQNRYIAYNGHVKC